MDNMTVQLKRQNDIKEKEAAEQAKKEEERRQKELEDEEKKHLKELEDEEERLGSDVISELGGYESILNEIGEEDANHNKKYPDFDSFIGDKNFTQKEIEAAKKQWNEFQTNPEKQAKFLRNLKKRESELQDQKAEREKKAEEAKEQERQRKLSKMNDVIKAGGKLPKELMSAAKEASSKMGINFKYF